MDEYLERWAEKYKPISHVPNAGSKEKRFYRIDAITSIPSFAANLVNAKSPSMAYVTQVDGTLGGQSEKFIMLSHRVFIFVKQQGTNLQNGVTEELAATDAKLLGAEIAQDLLAYIYHDWKKNGNKDLSGIDFKGSVIFTTPQQFNGWWPTELTFNEIVSRNLCVNPEKYHD
jgi:hypothetical protein